MSTHVLKVDAEGHKLRLDVYLARVLADIPSRTFVKKLIEDGHVKVNQTVVKVHYKVHDGEEISVEIPASYLAPTSIEPEDIALDVFYEDDYLLVVNKPCGMIVHPAQGNYRGTLVNALLHRAVHLSDVNSIMRPGIVHRLDQDTSGLILIAKDNISHTKLAKQFQKHKVKKQYVALVEGSVEFDEGTVDAPIGRHHRQREKKAVSFDETAKAAKTSYRVIKRNQGITMIALFPKTGRTHQLRVHMRHLGHPILGDEKYGRKENFFRLALHAQAIGFSHPATKKYLECLTKTPQEFLQRVQ